MIWFLYTKMAIDHIANGEKFCKIARAIARGGKVDTPYLFSEQDMLNVADNLNIHAAFHNASSHWRLIKEVLENDDLMIYDPLYPKNGSQVYRLPTGGNGASVNTYVALTIALQREYGMEPSRKRGKWFSEADILPEKEKLNLLRDKKYNISDSDLPPDLVTKPTQSDGHNCGPLILYGALVANYWSPEHHGKLPRDRLRYLQDRGINLNP